MVGATLQNNGHDLQPCSPFLSLSLSLLSIFSHPHISLSVFTSLFQVSGSSHIKKKNTKQKTHPPKGTSSNNILSLKDNFCTILYVHRKTMFFYNSMSEPVIIFTLKMLPLTLVEC